MDFRYLVETKNEFNNFLCGILIPHIFHGIKGMFKYSENVFEQIEQKNKRGAKISNPGVVQIFKKTLEGIKELNNNEIEEEYQRIKIKSGCIDFFDNLVRATFKSFVLFLTWDPKVEESKYTDNEIYEQLSIKDYIHKCYIISCDYFRENPEMFLNSRNNKKDIFEIIKNCIELAIKKSLPYNQIIEEYLQIEFTKKDTHFNQELADVKNLVHNIINNNKYGVKPNITNIIKEDSEMFVNVNVNNDNNNDKPSRKEEIENFINNEIIKEEREGVSLIETSNNINDDAIIESDSISNFSEQTVGTTSTQDSDSINQDASMGSDNSSVLTRSSMKSKELNEIIDEDNDSNTNESASSLSKVSKTSTQIINSPPAIRAKNDDRLQELQKLSTLNNTQAKKANVVMKPKKNLSKQIKDLDPYFGDMMK
jgi:hypothetical protein